MSNSNNGKKICTILSILTFTIGTVICTAFDDIALALAILYGGILTINTLIIENS